MTITLTISRGNDCHESDLLIQQQHIVEGVAKHVPVYDKRLKKNESTTVTVWDRRTFTASEVPALAE